MVLKTRHHNHYIQKPNLAVRGNPTYHTPKRVITLCSTCNVATHCDGFIKRCNLSLYLHNAKSYDFQIILDAISLVGKKKFTQIDKNGALVEMPIVYGTPKILFKSKTTIINIDIQFSCPILATCPFHSLDAKQKGKKKKGKNTIARSCPFSRKISLKDSCLILTSSIDDLLSDTRCRDLCTPNTAV